MLNRQGRQGNAGEELNHDGTTDTTNEKDEE
jgi:hypothetical protein